MERDRAFGSARSESSDPERPIIRILVRVVKTVLTLIFYILIHTIERGFSVGRIHGYGFLSMFYGYDVVISGFNESIDFDSVIYVIFRMI